MCSSLPSPPLAPASRAASDATTVATPSTAAWIAMEAITPTRAPPAACRRAQGHFSRPREGVPAGTGFLRWFPISEDPVAYHECRLSPLARPAPVCRLYRRLGL